MRRRLDLEIVRRGLAGTRAEAAAAIRAGRVTVGGAVATKPGTLVDPDRPVVLSGPARRFASRGGEKLDAALEGFGVDVAGRLALDAGASTGGFTDCLLSRGASHVVAVDVGYGQLDWRLRGDDRVTVLERTNVRSLGPEALPYRPDLVVADLSFISLAVALPPLAAVAGERADFVLLVKPQFEAGRSNVGTAGVVRDPAAWRGALERVWDRCLDLGLSPRDVAASPLTGPAGNVEFFLWARSGPVEAVPEREPILDRAVEAGLSVRARGRAVPDPNEHRAADGAGP